MLCFHFNPGTSVGAGILDKAPVSLPGVSADDEDVLAHIDAVGIFGTQIAGAQLARP